MAVAEDKMMQGSAGRSARLRLPKGFIYLAPALGFLLAFFVVPMAFMAAHSLQVRSAGRLQPGLTTENYARFFEKDALFGALMQSIGLTAATVAITLPLAYALAAAIAYGLPRKAQPFALALIVLPFWTSYVVRTYAWLLVLSDTGIVNQALIGLGLVGEPLRLVNSTAGVLIVFVHYFLMIMTLAIYVNLTRIPPNLIRAARDLGASWRRVFTDVILPQSVPGIAVGVFLTTVIAIGDYVTPQIIGGGRSLTLPQAVMLQVGRFADTPLAAAMSLILMMLILMLLLVFGRHLTGRAKP